MNEDRDGADNLFGINCNFSWKLLSEMIVPSSVIAGYYLFSSCLKTIQLSFLALDGWIFSNVG